jgi:hypothetical protein
MEVSVPVRIYPKSGYTFCACRDCFEIVVADQSDSMCERCQQAGCDLVDPECQRPNAYGVKE